MLHTSSLDNSSSQGSGVKGKFPDYHNYINLSQGMTGKTTYDGWLKLQTMGMDKYIKVVVNGQLFQCGESEYTRANCVIIPVPKGSTYNIVYIGSNCHVYFFRCL
jgi:hypothetical protein